MAKNGSVTADNKNKYLTQREVAERFRKSEGTIINWRRSGLLSFFSPPGARSVLYLMPEIEDFEKQYTTIRKGGGAKKKARPTKEKPDISATQKKWRI